MRRAPRLWPLLTATHRYDKSILVATPNGRFDHAGGLGDLRA